MDAGVKAWNAHSAYVTSIPGKTPGELWADYSAFTGGQVVGALSILGDLAQQVSSPVDDLKYVFLNTPQPPSSSEVLGSVAAWAGIKTDSTPYKAGVITGQIEGTIALTALTGGSGGAARAGSMGAKAAGELAPDIVAATRAGELQSGLAAGSKGRVTMGAGVGRDAEGGLRVVVGTSEPRGYIRPGVVVRSGEELATGPGHAEISILDYMSVHGIQPLEVGAGRPICPSCAEAIEAAGAHSATPIKKAPK